MKKGNVVSAILAIILGIYVWMSASKFPNLTPGVPGPGFFPKILAMITIGLGILLLIITFIKNEENQRVGIFSKGALKIYLTMGLIFLYLIGFTMIGFLILTPILLFILIKSYGMKSYIKNIMISIIVTSIIYGVFQVLLCVPLPTGVFLN